MKNKSEELFEILYWTLNPIKFTKAQKLIDEGADINQRILGGRTMLHKACIDAEMELIKFLIKNKIDVNILDYGGTSALHYI